MVNSSGSRTALQAADVHLDQRLRFAWCFHSALDHDASPRLDPGHKRGGTLSFVPPTGAIMMSSSNPMNQRETRTSGARLSVAFPRCCVSLPECVTSPNGRPPTLVEDFLTAHITPSLARAIQSRGVLIGATPVGCFVNHISVDLTLGRSRFERNLRSRTDDWSSGRLIFSR